jgi:DNA-binding transcriptional ArsR family regulator
MQIEDVFSSKQRMKILKLIFQLGNLNVSDISRRTNSNFGATNKHLLILEKEGILLVRTYGRIRMYRLNESSPKAKAVQHLLETWEQIGTKENE